MLIVEPRFSAEESCLFFRRPRWKNGFGLLVPANLRDRSKVALVYLPHYLISFSVTSVNGPGTLDVAVEALSGSFSVFEMREALVEREVSEECFPPKLSEQEAVAMGRDELVRSILRRRGYRDKPEVLEATAVELFYYPLWTLIYHTRGGKWGLFVFDAYRGDEAGTRTRVGVLEGMAGTPL